MRFRIKYAECLLGPRAIHVLTLIPYNSGEETFPKFAFYMKFFDCENVSMRYIEPIRITHPSNMCGILINSGLKAEFQFPEIQNSTNNGNTQSLKYRQVTECI